jgi:hypothetical protein
MSLATNPSPASARPSGFVLPFEVTLFFDEGASTKQQRTYTLASLAETVRVETKKEKARLPWLKLARFGEARTAKKSLRHNENVLAITGIEADYDGGKVTPEEAVEMLEKAGILGMVYTSPSHTEAAPRWRVLCPTSTELPPDQRSHLMARLNGLFRGILAPESWTLSQAYYYGSVRSNPAHRVAVVDGVPIDEAHELDEGAMGKAQAQRDAGAAPGPQAEGDVRSTAELVTQLVTGAELHGPATALAMRFLLAGVADGQAVMLLRGFFHAIPAGARNTASEPNRWASRYSEISRAVSSARAKLDAKAREEEPPQGNGQTFGRLKLKSVQDMLNVPAREYLLEGLIAVREFSVWWGPPKCGKSFLMLRLAYGMSQGLTMWGREATRCPVIYVAAEGQGGLGSRLEALQAKHGPAPDFHLIAQSVDLFSPDADMDSLIAAAMHIGAKMMVLDTLARVLVGGDENATRDMSAFVRNVDRLREEAKLHVAVVHHGGWEGTHARGSIALIGAADLVVKVSKGDGRNTATVTDAKDDESGYALVFTMGVVDLHPDGKGRARNTCLAEDIEGEVSTPEGRHKKLTPTEEGWLKDITDLFCRPEAEGGPTRRAVPGSTPTAPGASILTLTQAQLRPWLVTRERLTLDLNGALTSTSRTKLSNMLNSLKDKGKIMRHGGVVWLL